MSFKFSNEEFLFSYLGYPGYGGYNQIGYGGKTEGEFWKLLSSFVAYRRYIAGNI